MTVSPGTRRPDETQPWELEPGDYCLRKDRLWFCLPNGVGPCSVDSRWEITENEDGTITVSPSIQDIPADGSVGWHGFLEQGQWRGA